MSRARKNGPVKSERGWQPPPAAHPSTYHPSTNADARGGRKLSLSARGHNRDGREIRKRVRKKGRCVLGGEEVLASFAFASTCNGVEQPRSDAHLGKQGFHRTSRRETWRSCPFEKFVCRHAQAEGGLRSRAIWSLPATAPPPLTRDHLCAPFGRFQEKRTNFCSFST